MTTLVLAAVTTTSREEVAWITEGVGRIFPEAWQAFAEASGQRGDERIVEAYARRLAGDDAADGGAPPATGSPGRRPTSPSTDRRPDCPTTRIGTRYSRRW